MLMKQRQIGDDRMEFSAKWIRPVKDMGDTAPVFRKRWAVKKKIKEAKLFITSLGVYEAELNGSRVGDFVLAPGWTVYRKRLQYQEYDISELLGEENELCVTVGKGWFRSPMPGWMESEDKRFRTSQPGGLFAEIHLTYMDGSSERMMTDQSWECGESAVRFSEIYDGETFDASFQTKTWAKAEEFQWDTSILIPQEGEKIKEMEVFSPKSIFTTPAGETVVDFGQEITGYVEISLDAHAGESIKILHGEVLDKDGNFYNKNYRSAKAELNYICKDGYQSWHPRLTFFGFRYLKLVNFPQKPEPDNFKAIAVYSEIKKTGSIRCSDEGLNQLFSNIFWGQRGNFLDVPTDCPQRDERLGWTGDAQVFVKAASYNYDVERFFGKWLRDLAADQRENGAVGQVIPDYMPEERESAAWGDAAVICPWQIYQTYGDKAVLEEQFPSMKKWVDYITNSTAVPYLWAGGIHFGDWLGLDAPVGSYKGSSREELIATAFYAYSTELLVKAGRILGRDMAEYEELYRKIVEKFRRTYPEYRTQTECVLAVWFGLAENPQKTADQLAGLIRQQGGKMQTGFVGTPYILHVLSNYGYTELAYSLLLRREYPSWLYSVEKGATTIWEHWDGIMENGDFWSADMNSFNHYAYGAAADWVYEQAAGIVQMESAPGFSKVRIEPKPDRRLKWLEASVDTRNGRIESRWSCVQDKIKYEIATGVPADIVIAGKKVQVSPGRYVFWS